MTEKSDQYPEGVEPIEKANPDKTELSELVFMGQPVDLVKDDGSHKTSEEILSDLEDILAITQAPTSVEPLEVADALAEAQGELEAPEAAPEQNLFPPDVPEDPMADLTLPIPHDYGPEDPGIGGFVGERASRHNKHVIHLVPSTWEGKDAFFKLRNFSTDGIFEAAEDVQDCLVAGAFGTEERPTTPNILGFYAAGHDENDKLYIVWVKPMRDKQSDLYGLTPSITSMEVGHSVFKVGGGGSGHYLVIPIYNAALVEASSVACCVPKYSRLKFRAKPEGGGSYVTWASLPWMGDRYSGLDSTNAMNLEVFYDKCGRGWTGIIEPHNTESILDTGYPASAYASMIDIGTSGGTYVYTGGGPMLVGDLADDSVVSLILGNDVHPCDADLPNLNNHILDGSDVSALVNVSDTMLVETP